MFEALRPFLSNEADGLINGVGSVGVEQVSGDNKRCSSLPCMAMYDDLMTFSYVLVH